MPAGEKLLVPIHGSDHCPGGPDEIPCLGVHFFRAQYSHVTGLTGIDGGDTALDWLWWQNGHTGIFEPRKTTTAANPVQGTDLARYVRLKAPGDYTFTVGAKPEDAVLGLKLSLNENPEDDFLGYSEDGFMGPIDSAYEDVGMPTFSFSRTYPIIDPFSSDSAEELVEWPDFSAGEFVQAYFTVAAKLASGTTEVRHAFMEIKFKPATFPATTEWLV